MSSAELAIAINEGHAIVEGEIHTARRHASAALEGALRTGAYLREVQRRFGKSEWWPWVRKHCPHLSKSTAYRYIDLVRKFPHVRTAQEIPNLRQAYLAVGIIPDGPSKKGKAPPNLNEVPASSGTDLQARVRSMREFCGAQLGALDVTTLDEIGRTGLHEELTALRSMLDEVLGRIQKVGLVKTMDGKVEQ